MDIISKAVFVATRLACTVYTHVFTDTCAHACIMSRRAWDSWTDASRLVYASAFASNEVNVNEAQTSPDTVVRPSLLFTLSWALAATLRVHTTGEAIFWNGLFVRLFLRSSVRSTRSTSYSVVNARDVAKGQLLSHTKKFERLWKLFAISLVMRRFLSLSLRIPKWNNKSKEYFNT